MPMLTPTQIETLPLAAIVAELGELFSHSIDNEPLGIYSVTCQSDGSRSVWRARGEDVMPGQINKGLHIAKFPPDDGSHTWLETVAADACKNFYLAHAQQQFHAEEEARAQLQEQANRAMIALVARLEAAN